jgi:hypothetical protein
MFISKFGWRVWVNAELIRHSDQFEWFRAFIACTDHAKSVAVERAAKSAGHRSKFPSGPGRMEARPVQFVRPSR